MDVWVAAGVLGDGGWMDVWVAAGVLGDGGWMDVWVAVGVLGDGGWMDVWVAVGVLGDGGWMDVWVAGWRTAILLGGRVSLAGARVVQACWVRVWLPCASNCFARCVCGFLVQATVLLGTCVASLCKQLLCWALRLRSPFEVIESRRALRHARPALWSRRR